MMEVNDLALEREREMGIVVKSKHSGGKNGLRFVRCNRES